MTITYTYDDRPYCEFRCPVSGDYEVTTIFEPNDHNAHRGEDADYWQPDDAVVTTSYKQGVYTATFQVGYDTGVEITLKAEQGEVCAIAFVEEIDGATLHKESRGVTLEFIDEREDEDEEEEDE